MLNFIASQNVKLMIRTERYVPVIQRPIEMARDASCALNMYGKRLASTVLIINSVRGTEKSRIGITSVDSFCNCDFPESIFTFSVIENPYAVDAGLIGCRKEMSVSATVLKK